MTRIRVGIRLNLPLGLFPGAGTFVIYGDFIKLSIKMGELKSLLYSFHDKKATELADRLFCEKG
jgi:hypothetical protein